MHKLGSITFLGMLLLAGCSRTYESTQTMLASPDYAGYVLLGQFGASWPASVVGERDAVDGIRFDAPGRGPQLYSPEHYRGWGFKLVRLKARNGHELVVLLRRKRKLG